MLPAERLDGDRRHDGRVDTARKADAGLAVAVLAEEVAHAATSRLVDHARTALVGRGNMHRLAGRFGVEQGEILLEALHHQHQIAAPVESARRAVVDDIRSAAHLIDHHEVLALDEGEVTHQLVAVGHRPAAVFAGIDRNDGLDRLVVVALAAQVVADDDRALVALDRRVFIPFRGVRNPISRRAVMYFLPT